MSERLYFQIFYHGYELRTVGYDESRTGPHGYSRPDAGMVMTDMKMAGMMVADMVVAGRVGVDNEPEHMTSTGYSHVCCY